MTVLSRSLFSILLMKNRELVDLEMYYFMCGILVLAFPMSSLLTPEILFESKNQIAVNKLWSESMIYILIFLDV